MSGINVTILTVLTGLGEIFASNCSNISRHQGVKPIELGEIITIHKIPYLNDHTIIYSPFDGKWHLFGIEGQHTSFIHLIADSLTQQGWVKKESFTDGEAEIRAPHIVFDDSLFHMFYTRIGIPREIHHIVSKNLYDWSRSASPVLALSNEYNENLKNKDPMVFRDDPSNQWVMYYSMMKDDKHWVVGYCTSDDLYKWSAPQICFDKNTESPGVESPFVFKYGEDYYLFLSARPWPIGGEDVFRSNSPFAWDPKDIVKRIDPWHAAGVVSGLDGNWYLTLSSGTQAQDLRIARLFWK